MTKNRLLAATKHRLATVIFVGILVLASLIGLFQVWIPTSQEGDMPIENLKACPNQKQTGLLENENDPVPVDFPETGPELKRKDIADHFTSRTDYQSTRPLLVPKPLEQKRISVSDEYDPRNTWYVDAPYFEVKDRFEELTNSDANDIENMAATYKLAEYLNFTHFGKWFAKDPGLTFKRDCHEKAMLLYQCVFEKYPPNELLVIKAKARYARLYGQLRRDTKGTMSAYTKILNTPLETIVDSTRPEDNKILSDASRVVIARSTRDNSRRRGASGGRRMLDKFLPTESTEEGEKATTKAQLSFIRERNSARTNLLYQIHLLKGAEFEKLMVLSEVVAACKDQDPDIVPATEHFRSQHLNKVNDAAYEDMLMQSLKEL